MDAAIAWIGANPGRFASLTAERFVLIWFPPIGLGLTASTILGFVGLLLCWRTNRRAALLTAAPLMLYPLVYYATHTFVRYRYPILWISFLLAGHALYTAYCHFFPPSIQPVTTTGPASSRVPMV